jgi:nucleolin
MFADENQSPGRVGPLGARPTNRLTRHARDDRRPTRAIDQGRTAIPTRIFVGNLNRGTTAEALTQLLSEAGSVVEVYLPADRETGHPRGFAFVQFATEANALEAIRLFHDRELDGRKLTVNAAEDRPARRDGPPRFDPGRSSGAGSRAGQGRPFKRKGSRRGLRRRKRSL